MHQLEPILGKPTPSCFPFRSEVQIPNGIVEKRRQIFVERNYQNNSIEKHGRSIGYLNIFETPTTSSDELHSTSSRKYYPITKVMTTNGFENPKTSEERSRITARVRILPPPKICENRSRSSPKLERLDVLKFGITAPSELLSEGPIWVNSGPPISKPREQIFTHVSKLWRPGNNGRHNLVTRVNRSTHNNLPSLTINVNHNGSVNRQLSREMNTGPISAESEENDGFSCHTDWRYFESSPRITETRRLEMVERNQQPMVLAMQSNRDNTSLGSSRRTSEDQGSVASDSSQIMSMHSQIVRYSTNNLTAGENPNLEDAIMSDRETSLVVRLERELTEAQSCNHRLNQQLKTLVNSSNPIIKKELTETKKQLKERVHEVEDLRKQLERSMWLSKQPNDVSTLMAEKQELRKQLEREQSEKQELFMQINSMIAQLADAEDREVTNQLRNQVNSLKRELDTEKISSQAESARLQSEVRRYKKELEDHVSRGDTEKDQLEQEIENLQNQLDIKSASIQSLMLVKSDTSKINDLSSENEKLKCEMDELRKKLAASTSQVVEKQSEIMRLKDASSLNDVAKEKLEELTRRLNSMENQMREEQKQKEKLGIQAEELKRALSQSEEALGRLKNKISEFEKDAICLKEENNRLEMLQRDNSHFSSGQIHELNQRLTEEKEANGILNSQLKEKDGRIDKIKVELLSAESRAQQAEADLKAMENRAQAAERKEQSLEAQLKAHGDSNEQMELLRCELTKSEERCQLAQNRMQKVEAQLKEKEVESRQRSDSLENALKESSRLKEEIKRHIQYKEESSNSSNDVVNSLKLELAEKDKKLNEEELKCRKLKQDLEELSAELKKREQESKSSVADEITTLMSSLNSVRQENSQYEEEIRVLQNEIRSIRDELYQQQDECVQWKMSAEKAASDLEHQVQKVQLLQSNQESHSSRFEAEQKRFEEIVEKAREEKEEIKRECLETVSNIRAQSTENTILLEREVKDLKEKMGDLTRELESSKRRVEQLQDEQCKFIGSQDEMKTELLKEVREQQDKAEETALELASVKSKNVSLTQELEQSELCAKELKEKMKKLEMRHEEAMNELMNSEDTIKRLKDAQIFNGNIESKMEDLQEENKKRMDKMMEDHRKEVDSLRDELRKSHNEYSSLEGVLEEQQKELVKHREETDALQDQIRAKDTMNGSVVQLEKELGLVKKEKEEIARKIGEYENKLAEANKTNESLISSVQEMTALLQSESKRLEEVSEEKKILDDELLKLKNVSSGEENNNERIKELVAENARLAGELLKSHNSSERSLQSEREQIAKQFEERLKSVNLEKTRLASELHTLKSREKGLEEKIEEQKRDLDAAEKRRRDDIHQLEILREEFSRYRDGIQNNGPVAPPRSTRTISNMSAMTNWTQADFSECEDLTRLRSEIDKQKRLIIVLRRKLQGIQQQTH